MHGTRLWLTAALAAALLAALAVAAVAAPGEGGEEVRMPARRVFMPPGAGPEDAAGAEAPLDQEGMAARATETADAGSGEPASEPASAPEPAPTSEKQAASAKAAETGYVTGLRLMHGQGGAMLTLVVDTTRTPGDVTYFSLPDKGKVAIDLHGAWAKRGASIKRFDMGPVRHVIAGRHPDRLRLVVQYAEPFQARPKLGLAPREGGLDVTLPAAP